jgi:hypothetical protein
MATSRSRNVKHSDRDLDIALKRPPGLTQSLHASAGVVSPPELTVPGTQARHFDVLSIPWERTDKMSQVITDHCNKLAKQSRGVVTVCGIAQDDHRLTVLLEYWTF